MTAHENSRRVTQADVGSDQCTVKLQQLGEGDVSRVLRSRKSSWSCHTRSRSGWTAYRVRPRRRHVPSAVRLSSAVIRPAGNSAAKSTRDLGIDKMRRVQSILGQCSTGGPVVEQRRQCGPCVDDDHRAARALFRSSTISLTSTCRSGSAPRSSGSSGWRRKYISELADGNGADGRAIARREPLQPPHDVVGYISQIQCSHVAICGACPSNNASL